MTLSKCCENDDDQGTWDCAVFSLAPKAAWQCIEKILLAILLPKESRQVATVVEAGVLLLRAMLM